MSARTLALPVLLGLSLLAGCSAAPPRREAVRVVYVAPPRCEWIAGHWRWTGDDDRVWIPGHCDRD
jgi:hypothetical protein